ncbi:hypothetical protein CVT25_002545 [Psilocybe cyanescens]|uniref:Uncharacterized protein n=1 Tax=Psilocybe cyanescens TaxID=93625 RepID=A0A409XUU7_PSICY|nr:hypothetical protein CVT25_002545 [Psilocybe cyanescens]
MFQRQGSCRKEQDTRINPFPLVASTRNITKPPRNPTTSEAQQPTNGHQTNFAPHSPRDDTKAMSVASSATQATLEPPQQSWHTTLTAGGQMLSTRPRADTSTSKHSRSFKSMDEGSPLPGNLPPAYNNIPIPDVAIAYSFSQIGTSNAMFVVPRQGAVDTRPLYYVSVGHEPFLPTCLVTSIFRGSSDQDTYVGSFQTTLLQSDNSGQAISIRGSEGRQSDVFKPGTKKKGNQTFDWGDGTMTRIRLQWTCPNWPSAGTFTCRNPVNNHVYAEYSVSSRRLEPKENPLLTVLPIGHSVFDDLVLSILLLERRRLLLLPDTGPHNPLSKKN